MLALSGFEIDHLWCHSTVAVVALFLILAYAVVHAAVKDRKKGQAPRKVNLIEEADYADLDIPKHPHMELALDPPTGLHWSNPSEPYVFENDYCYGKYIHFHPSTADGVDEGYSKYFRGKSRIWELRIQLQFKRKPPPENEICFGVELESYVPVNAMLKRTQSVIVAALRSAAGNVYHSCGDDPSTATGELEKPCCVLPLWAFDQFIVTPPGQSPPELKDPSFPDMGKKRYKRVRDFVKEINEVKDNFDVGPTYTFSTWGVSRFLDVLNWRLLGIPMVTPLDFNKFCGRPPVYFALYGLRPRSDDKDDRHILSRKQYYFRLALWSSSLRPDRQRFEQLTGTTMSCEPFKERSTKQSFWGQMKNSLFVCCTQRS